MYEGNQKTLAQLKKSTFKTNHMVRKYYDIRMYVIYQRKYQIMYV